MWVWTLNWGEIRGDIVIGSCPIATADIDQISQRAGVSALLSLQTDDCRAALGVDYERHVEHSAACGLTLVNAPMRDFNLRDQQERLPEAIASLHRLISDGHRVYVHCTAGINRAPLTVLAYLTFVEGMTSSDAMVLIHRGRPEASPHWEAYIGCRQDVLARKRREIELRAWQLHQRTPGNPADTDWFQAEREILSESWAHTAGLDDGPSPRRRASR